MIIYVDMDGVLVDFMGGINDVLGPEFSHINFPTDDEVRKRRNMELASKHPGFWENLKPMPDWDVLWNYLHPTFSPHILTAMARWDEADSTQGKIKWNDKWTKVEPEKLHIVFRRDKKNFATDPHTKRPNILIDDFQKNIDEWRECGGIGILHTNAWTTIPLLEYELGID